MYIYVYYNVNNIVRKGTRMNRRFNSVVKIIRNVYPSLLLEEKDGCIRLSGVLDTPSDVAKAGVLASGKGYKGVLNDIRVKGEERKLPEANFHSNALDGASPSVLIIGAGLLGLTIARELARYALTVIVVDKNGDIGEGYSGKTYGNVRVDLSLNEWDKEWYYAARGYSAFPRLLKELDVPFSQNGQLLFLSDRLQTLAVPYLKHKAKRQEIKSGRYLNKSALHKLEPCAPDWAKGALFFPKSGVVDPLGLCVALAQNLISNGVRIEYDTLVEDMAVSDGWIKEVKTNRGVITPQIVVNAAGIWADIVADMAKDRDFSILPVKENYMVFSKENAIKREYDLICGKKSIGISPTVDGNIIIGRSEHDSPRREDFSTKAESLTKVYIEAKRFCEDLEKKDVLTYFSGIAARTYEGKLTIRRGLRTKNVIEAVGLSERGFTAIPAIAVEVSELAVGMLDGAKENFAFQPSRERPTVMKELSFEVADEKILSDPSYGEIICRCSLVTKGEILDILKNHRDGLEKYTLDAVKKRLGVCKGECRGTRCAHKIAEIIAEHYDIPLESVYQKSDGQIVRGDV